MQQDADIQDARTDSPHDANAGAQKVHLLGISRSRDTCPIPGSPNPEWIVQEPLAAAAVPRLSASSAPLDHARWLEAIHRHITILPVQFSSRRFREDTIRGLLDSRQACFLRQLDRLDGTCEIGLRIELVRNPTPTESSMRDNGCDEPISPADYLTLRQAWYEQQDRWKDQASHVAEHFARNLRDLYRDWRTLTPGSSGTVRLSFLIDQVRLQEFNKRVHVLVREQKCRRGTLLGPWPPYSFVELFPQDRTVTAKLSDNNSVGCSRPSPFTATCPTGPS